MRSATILGSPVPSVPIMRAFIANVILASSGSSQAARPSPRVAAASHVSISVAISASLKPLPMTTASGGAVVVVDEEGMERLPSPEAGGVDVPARRGGISRRAVDASWQT